MVLHNSEKGIRITRPFRRPFLVTEVFWSKLCLSYSSEPVMKLGFQILLKSSHFN